MILPAAGFQLLRGFLSRMESHARRSPPPIVSACRYVAARVESVSSKQIFHISQAKCRSSELSLLPVATTVLVVVVIVGAANFLPTPVDMLKVS